MRTLSSAFARDVQATFLCGDERQELMAFRRLSLLMLMREVSEDCWASGWYPGLDAALYRIVFDGASPEYGRGEVSLSDQALLRECASRAGCWYRYDDADDEPVAISLDAAQARFQRIRPKGIDGIGRTVQEVLDLYDRSGPDDWAAAFETYEDDPQRTPAWNWFYSAREIHVYRADNLVRLARRTDAKFDLCYGEDDIRAVEPSWLSKEPPRADGCIPDRPCGATRRCVWCAEARFSRVDDLNQGSSQP